MQRKIEQWKNCVPDAMVHMSIAAIRYAFEDAKSDILSLWEDNQRLRLLEKENQKLTEQLHDVKEMYWSNLGYAYDRTTGKEVD